MAQVVFEHLGFQVKRAKRVREAVLDSSFGTPDLMILTTDLSDEDKVSLATIRARCETQTIPTIAIAAKNSPDIENTCRLLGFHDYVYKPLSLNNLEAALQRLRIALPGENS